MRPGFQNNALTATISVRKVQLERRVVKGLTSSLQVFPIRGEEGRWMIPGSHKVVQLFPVRRMNPGIAEPLAYEQCSFCGRIRLRSGADCAFPWGHRAPVASFETQRLLRPGVSRGKSLACAGLQLLLASATTWQIPAIECLWKTTSWYGRINFSLQPFSFSSFRSHWTQSAIIFPPTRPLLRRVSGHRSRFRSPAVQCIFLPGAPIIIT